MLVKGAGIRQTCTQAVTWWSRAGETGQDSQHKETLLSQKAHSKKEGAELIQQAQPFLQNYDQITHSTAPGLERVQGPKETKAAFREYHIIEVRGGEKVLLVCINQGSARKTKSTSELFLKRVLNTGN